MPLVVWIIVLVSVVTGSLSLAEVENDRSVTRFDCFDKCMADFAGSLQQQQMNSDGLTNRYLCMAYQEATNCVGRCPGGMELLRGLARIVPKSYKSLVNSCDPRLADVIVPPPVVADLLAEGLELSEMETCAKNCEHLIEAHMLTQDPNLKKVCAGWNEYQKCIRSCPKGDSALALAKKTFKRMFHTIEAACVGPITAVLEPPALEPSIVIMEPSPPVAVAPPGYDVDDCTQNAPPSPPSPPAPYGNQRCMEDCMLSVLSMNMSQARSRKELCEQWFMTKKCLKGCDGGYQVLEKIARLVPKSYAILKTVCRDSEDTASRSSESSSYEGEATSMLSKSGEDVEAMEECISNCEQHFEAILAQSGHRSAMCNEWKQFEQCVVQCPSGTLLLDSAKESFPKVFHLIEIACDRYGRLESESNESSGSNSGSSSESKSDESEEPSLEYSCIQRCAFNATSVLQSKSPVRICNAWKTTKVCFKGCPHGRAFMTGMAKLGPRTYHTLKMLCNDPDAIETDPSLYRALIGEGEEARDTAECMQDCEHTVWDAISHGTRDSIPSCQIWSGYVSCIKTCPNGAVVMDTSRKAFREVFRMIDEKCGPRMIRIDLPTPNLPVSNQISLVQKIPKKMEANRIPIGDFYCLVDCSATISTVGQASSAQRGTDGCSDWRDMESCFSTCPSGPAVLEAVSRLLPNIYQVVVEDCLNNNEVASSDAQINAALIHAAESDSPTGLEAIRCVSRCKSFAKSLLLSIDQEHADVCQPWFQLETCVKACPRGQTAVTAGQEVFKSIFNAVKSRCQTEANAKFTQPTSTQEHYNLAIMPPSTTQTFTAAGNSGLVMEGLGCLNTCTMKLAELGKATSASQTQFCRDWESVQDCFRGCHNGEAILDGIARGLPKGYQLVQEMCADPDKSAMINRQLAETINAENTKAVATYDCVSRCRDRLMTMMRRINSGEEICESWFKLEKCVVDCPGGLNTIATAKSAFKVLYDNIRSTCGAHNQLLGLPPSPTPQPTWKPKVVFVKLPRPSFQVDAIAIRQMNDNAVSKDNAHNGGRTIRGAGAIIMGWCLVLFTVSFVIMP
jgi:hypothetical protein